MVLNLRVPQAMELVISLILILILSSDLRQVLPKGLFPVGVPVKMLKTLVSSSILAKRRTHLNLQDVCINEIGNTADDMTTQRGM